MNDKKITRREFLISTVRYALLASTALLFGIKLRNFHKKEDCPITRIAALPEQCIMCNVRPSCPVVRVKKENE